MAEDTVNVEVDGVPMKARKGDMIIRVTDANGVYVPRFCYHEKLSIAANCRMCLVEVEKAPKPLPACATPVAEGMKIFTRSQRAIGAQRATMEFLLINHPLDCPICDQGGECELQDLAMGFGRDVSRYTSAKRVVPDENLGPLIATDMTRCIHCTRCIRFTEEIAGIQELGMLGRGEHMRVRSAMEHTVDHELSGNVIDLCPVGALVSKPSRFTQRSWEMSSTPVVSPHDGLGSNLYAHVLRGRLMRVVPRDNEAINENWAADRDRFSYEGVYSPDRLMQPMLREGGDWVATDWERALGRLASELKDRGPELGVLANPSATLEELYLLARITRALGSSDIDHRLRLHDTRDADADPAMPALGLPIAEVESLDALLVVGSHLRHELPLLAHRVRNAARRGAKIAFMNPARFPVHFPVAAWLESGAAGQVSDLAALLGAVAQTTGTPVPAHLKDVVGGAPRNDAHGKLAAALLTGERRAIWLGALALRHPRWADLRALAAAIAAAAGAKLGILAEGANAAGAWLAGAVPHREAGGRIVAQPGMSAPEMLARGKSAWLLFGGVEPWADPGVGNPADTLRAFAGAQFVAALTPFDDERLREHAHLLLPIGTFAETSGTYLNLEGRWQSQAGAAVPVGEARPGWKVLRVLGNLLGLPGYEYLSSEAVRDELQGLCAGAGLGADAAAATGPGYGGRHAVSAAGRAGPVVDVPMYAVDALVRRAPSLQKTAEGRRAAAVYR